MKALTKATRSIKPAEVEKKWHIIDAEGLVVGRLATNPTDPRPRIPVHGVARDGVERDETTIDTIGRPRASRSIARASRSDVQRAMRGMNLIRRRASDRSIARERGRAEANHGARRG